MQIVKVSYEQSRLDFFKKQLDDAERKLKWSLKHRSDDWIDHSEKGEVVSFYDWAVEMAKKDVSDTNVGKWIPVAERLPKEEDADVTGCVLAIEISDGFARRWEIEAIQRCSEFFTHWMPLPEPPKGE